MNATLRATLVATPVFALVTACQVINKGTENRTEEQMLNVSFENPRVQALFNTIIHGTERQSHTTRIGAPAVSLYSRSETVAFNAHCNDHIRAMDKDSNLFITQQEADAYYRALIAQGRLSSPEAKPAP